MASSIAFSQVGIGTQNPSSKSILDLTATNKGFLLPRMTTTERTAIGPNNGTDKGMQVFDTTTNTIWFWNGSIWTEQGSGGGSGDATNDAFVNNPTNTRVELGTNANGSTARATGTEFVIQDNGNVGVGTVSPISKLHSTGTVTVGGTNAGSVGTAQLITGASSPISNRLTFGTDGTGWKMGFGKNQGGTVTEILTITDSNNVGIGTTTPNSESILDIESTNKGILIPRVNITSTTFDLDGDGTQPIGLMVFNTGTTLPIGFYFWNGSEWRNFKDSSAVIPAISTINCTSVSLSPKTYVSGAPYVGSMSVSYTGGNGASYSNGTGIASTGVTGLTATLRAGTLNVGDGVLIYDITGTPSASSPSTATFAIPTTFGAAGCNAVVGQGNVFAIGEVQSYRMVVNYNTFMTNAGAPWLNKATDAGGTIASYTVRSAYGLQTPAQQLNCPVINGLRMDFIRTPFGNGNQVTPTLHNISGVSKTYSVSGLSTNDAYIYGANTILPANTHSFRIDGDDSIAIGSLVGSFSEYVNAMLTFPDGQWYQITYHASQDATNIYFYMTAQRLN